MRVETVSRFRPPAEVKRVLGEYREGKVDVLIGTHRVLSRDVVAGNLGLVVVDEEQRFGVAQKELLRQMRLEVDVLAMSATPIPRTLHMSLSGLRDISISPPPAAAANQERALGEFRRAFNRRRVAPRACSRGSVLLPPQPGRDDRRGGRAGAKLGASCSRRRPRPNGGSATAKDKCSSYAPAALTNSSRPRSSVLTRHP